MKRLILIAALLPALTLAEITPRPGALDSRIRVVNYNPMQVVKVNTFFGVATHIQFEDGEQVEDGIMGNPVNWQVKKMGNHIYARPLKDHADTNMTVITNKQRTYNFLMVVQKLDENNPNAWVNPENFFTLFFKYPDVEEQKRAEKEMEAKIEQEKQEAEKRFDAALAHVYNDDYWGRGDKEIIPTAAHDDGNFVFLEFGNNGDIPAIYDVDKNGDESIVNSHTEGNTVIIEKMAPKYMLRRGKLVADVVNRSMAKGRDNKSGTVATDVELIVKEPK